MDANQKFQKIIRSLIRRAAEAEIVSEIPLEPEQLAALQNLNRYCVNQVLNDTEVVYDPRKINYKSNQELKAALVALLLSRALTDPSRRRIENKEYFAENVTVYMQGEQTKVLGFGELPPYQVQESLYPEIINDWMIYRDNAGLGIKALIDNKTNLVGLDSYRAGGDPIYEFARFHRKYTEKELEKEEKRRENAQEALRNALVQSLAAEVSKRQLLAGQDPLALIDRLISSTGQYRPQPQNRQIDRQVENDIARLLEYDDRDNGRER